MHASPSSENPRPLPPAPPLSHVPLPSSLKNPSQRRRLHTQQQRTTTTGGHCCPPLCCGQTRCGHCNKRRWYPCSASLILLLPPPVPAVPARMPHFRLPPPRLHLTRPSRSSTGLSSSSSSSSRATNARNVLRQAPATCLLLPLPLPSSRVYIIIYVQNMYVYDIYTPNVIVHHIRVQAHGCHS
jgi:hypothetical protein